MGFQFTVPIRLRISEIAYAVLLQDINDFQNSPEKPKISSFLNFIINNYYDASASAVNYKTYEIRQKYRSWFASEKEEQHAGLINLLTEKELKERYSQIQERYSSPPSGKGKEIRFKPDKEVRRILEKYDENLFYPSASKFLSAIVQEYTSLSRVQRERIYFGEIFQTIEKCIEYSCQAEITLYHQKIWRIRPYAIVPDIFSSWNYVFGYACSQNQPYAEEKMLSFRIQRIHDAKMCQSFDFSSDEKKRLQEIMQHPEQIPFLPSENVHGRVRLTPAGWKLYQYYIRTNQPAFTKKIQSEEDVILEFNCTEAQLYYYFIKFGSNAEILEPLTLRERFRKIYETASSYYLL